MKNKQGLSLYWKCQLTGWSVAALYWTVVSLDSPDFILYLAVLYFVGDLLIYIPLTHIYRNISLKYGWQKLEPKKLLIRIIPAILVLGLAFLILTWSKNYLLRHWFEANFSGSFWYGFEDHRLTIFMTGVRLMTIWLLAYYGYHYAQREINAVKESSRLAIIAKEAEFNNLAAQLNPHFFFNSLNSIKALLIENPTAARRAIDLLSDLMRTSLYSRDAVFITLAEEMALVRDYLELESIRFEKRLQTFIEMDDRLSGKLILPLNIQILVENAIKHGIAQKKEGGLVAIRVEQSGGMLQVSVENPGILKNESAGGLGLKNLKERLKLQFADQASFRIIQKDIGTVLATVKIPLT